MSDVGDSLQSYEASVAFYKARGDAAKAEQYQSYYDDVINAASRGCRRLMEEANEPKPLEQHERNQGRIQAKISPSRARFLRLLQRARKAQKSKKN